MKICVSISDLHPAYHASDSETAAAYLNTIIHLELLIKILISNEMPDDAHAAVILPQPPPLFYANYFPKHFSCVFGVQSNYFHHQPLVSKLHAFYSVNECDDIFDPLYPFNISDISLCEAAEGNIAMPGFQGLP